MNEEARATSAELKKRQNSGGDWYRMDQKPEVKEVKKFDIDAHSARTKTPLPGLRDSDLNQEALPSARHAVKEEYSDYVKLAKSGGHQGLLKIDGAAKEQNGDVRPRSRINDTDSAYVKMAKIGGHANLLKTNGAPVVESPRKNQIKETDSEYIKLAKKGGHSGLLKSDGKEAENAVRKNKIKDSDSEYVRLAKAGGHSNLLASESTTPKAESSLPRRRTSNEGSDYVKLAKKGGDADLLKMVEKKPATPNQKYKSASSDWFQHNDKRTPEPITTGKGKGARKDTNNNSNSVILPSAEPQTQKSGKRLYQVQTDRAPAPFALHY
ncbi:uncharacterized protein LOC135681159 isoform X3 [Rhopilema esculentum]|uniref:uncharacterized protein LOC135681159 isoform X3 n=1 Tax=Rhopilema esculentum TaxID=499914 RepID=UPI0031DABE1F